MAITIFGWHLIGHYSPLPMADPVASSASKTQAPVPSVRLMDDQLKQLLDYTKFHIGMYVTLASFLIAFLTKDKFGLDRLNYHYWLLCSLALLALSGMAGGLVASSIPDFARYRDFMRSPVGPGRLRLIRARQCIALEHRLFWLAVTNAVIGLFVSTYTPFGKRGWPGTLAFAGIAVLFLAAAGWRHPVRRRRPKSRAPSPVT